jgi:hypothetical protein
MRKAREKMKERNFIGCYSCAVYRCGKASGFGITTVIGLLSYKCSNGCVWDYDGAHKGDVGGNFLC